MLRTLGELMEWMETLIDIFCGYLNQDTPEEAIAAMVFVSHENLDWHRRFSEAFEKSMEMARRGDAAILGIINRNVGYQVASVERALDLLQHLHRIYEERYKNTLAAEKPSP